jgi:hypothetical protein
MTIKLSALSAPAMSSASFLYDVRTRQLLDLAPYEYIVVRCTCGRMWAVTDAPEDSIASLVRQIIGFRMPIRQLEGKWKLGRNRPLDDRPGVAHGLEQEGKSSLAAITRP